MDNVRLIFVAAAVVQLTLWLMLAGRYKTPAAPPGGFVLRYGWKLRLLGLCIAFAIPMLLIVVLSITSSIAQAPVIRMSVTLLVLGFVGGWLLVETQGVHVIVTDATLASVSPWRRRREWRWSEIERIEYSTLNRWLVLRGPRQEAIRASLSLVGIDDLARAILKQVAGPKYAPARKVLDRLSEMRTK